MPLAGSWRFCGFPVRRGIFAGWVIQQSVLPQLKWGYSLVGTSSFVTGDSAVGTTSSAVGDSVVGTPSFNATPCYNVGLMGNVWLLLVSEHFPFAASKYDFDLCKKVETKLWVTCSVSQFVNAPSFDCWFILLVASFWMSNLTPLYRSDLLHKSSKWKL